MENKLLFLLFILFFLLILVHLTRKKIKRIRMFFFKKHVIVIGLSKIGTQIAINLSKAGRNVIVISNEPLGPDAEVIKRNGGFVILSKGIDERALKRAGLANASTVFIASSNDDINIKLAQFISRLKKRKYY